MIEQTSCIECGQPAPAYTSKDVGCWIDGAFGMDHTAWKLSTMLIDAMPLSKGTNVSQFPSEELADVYDALTDGNLSDDDCEFDDATEYLQSITEDGLVWVWEAGDLILTTEEDLTND